MQDPSLLSEKFFIKIYIYLKAFLPLRECLERTYSRTRVTQTLKGNEKQFKLVGNLSYRGKFQGNLIMGKEI